jgi:hypothetical protein
MPLTPAIPETGWLLPPTLSISTVDGLRQTPATHLFAQSQVGLPATSKSSQCASRLAFIPPSKLDRKRT